MSTRAIVFSLVLLVSTSEAILAESGWKPSEFPISFWCGPPDPYITTSQFQRIADAGFNYVMPPCEGVASEQRNLRILDTAQSVGLKAFILDYRMPRAISGVPNAIERIDRIIAAYSKHPAFAGYFLADEPNVAAFPGLAEVVNFIRTKDPQHPAFINLFPNYASPSQLGVQDYEEYVRQYVDKVKPSIISYDHYSFLKTGDRPDFFPNLKIVREIAHDHELPFWQIVLAVPHLVYRPINEAEKRWEAMQTLAFGGQGLLWFTYWTPPDSDRVHWGPAIVSRKGELTPQYAQIKRINAEIRAIGRYLIDAEPIGVLPESSSIPARSLPRPDVPVAVVGVGDVGASIFRRGEFQYVLFVNGDYKKPTRLDVWLLCGDHSPHMLDKESGNWLAVHGERNSDNDLLTQLSLEPGDGELYRW